MGDEVLAIGSSQNSILTLTTVLGLMENLEDLRQMRPIQAKICLFPLNQQFSDKEYTKTKTIQDVKNVRQSKYQRQMIEKMKM